VILLPPLAPAYGAVSLSPLTTRTSPVGTPNASAAICANPVLVPLMSTEPTMMLSVPSRSMRQAAFAGSMPPIQPPTATPTPTRRPAGALGRGRRPRSCCRRSRHSRSPIFGHGCPVTIGSPGLEAFLSRKSRGSMPVARASSSMSDSTTNVPCTAPGAR
jgi:hypothetical protein